jgi:hypothetical protein
MRAAVFGKPTATHSCSVNLMLILFLGSPKRKAEAEPPIESPQEARRLVSEISDLTERVRRVPALEEGKVEEIERSEDRILREYSEMSPRKRSHFLRDLSELAATIDALHKDGTLSEKQYRILEYMIKKTRMRDFFVARRLLIKFAKPLELKKERDAKLERYRSYHRKIEARGKDLRSEIARMKSVPMPEKSPEDVAAAKGAVEEYNAAATHALVDFFAHAPCVEAISFALEASSVPELSLPAPKSRESVKELVQALQEAHVKGAFGKENMSKLVEAATYSEKRLEHFVKDFKWFQKQLQENAGWLSELTAARSDALRIAWPDPAEQVMKRISVIEPFLVRLPRGERAVQALASLRGMIEGGDYGASLRSEAVYKAQGEAAVARFRGTLGEEISRQESELAEIQRQLADLPGTDKLLARAPARGPAAD